MSAAPSPGSTRVSEKPKVTLSCLQCQQRKRKCDKSSPCGACTQSGIDCTPILRARKPRGRHVVGKDTDLKQRISRLETLLLAQNNGESGSPSNAVNATTKEAFDSAVSEIAGIQKLLEQAGIDDDDVDEDGSTPGSDMIETTIDPTFEVVLFGDRSCFVPPEILQIPSPTMQMSLLNIYLERVDQLIKVVHAPSLRLALAAADTTPAQQALRFAIYYAAVCTLSDQECYECFHCSRESLANQYDLAAQVCLSRAGLMTTPTMMVLQAYVIYLCGQRGRRGAQAGPIAIGLAVRVARTLGVDTTEKRDSPFDTEMRRRLLIAIGILENQASFDSGTYCMLTDTVFPIAAPLHVDDADISPAMTIAPEPKDRFTDVTFFSMAYTILYHQRLLNYTPLDVDGKPLMTQDWARRDQILEDFITIIRQKYLRYCNPTITFHRLIITTGEGLITVLRLLNRRPMYRIYTSGPPPQDGFSVLDAVVDELEQDLQKHSNVDYKKWTWFIWPKWYALAVLLTELCEYTEGPLLAKAWRIAEANFEYHKGITHDKRLYRAIEKLMQKARAARDSHRNIDNKPAFTNGDFGTQVSQPFDLPTDVAPIAVNGVDHFATPAQAELAASLYPGNSWNNWEAFVQDLSETDVNMAMNDWAAVNWSFNT